MTRLRVVSPVKGANGKVYWHKLGNAYPNNDGSITLYLDALPVNGKLVVLAEEEIPVKLVVLAEEEIPVIDATGEVVS